MQNRTVQNIKETERKNSLNTRRGKAGSGGANRRIKSTYMLSMISFNNKRKLALRKIVEHPLTSVALAVVVGLVLSASVSFLARPQ